MLKLINVVSLLILTLTTQSSSAQLVYDFTISQGEQKIVFNIDIENNELQNLPLQLSNEAHNLRVQNAKIQKSQLGSQITIEQGQKANVQYELTVDLTGFTFFTEDKAWYPVSSNDDIEETYSVKTNFKNDLHLVNSATGKTQKSLAMVLGPFKVYKSTDSSLKVYLQAEDKALADTLLSHLQKYKDHYEKTISAYPHEDFSVVESPDEIGWAFPKMTWIGKKLLRFPFILKTSLPHELLHSWWGNGVYVDYDKGNWCEGLTTYGADYGLLSEAEKKIYRIKTLTTYLDYVKSGNEIALADFVSRGEDPALQAIGYGKSMMVFVMLEQMLGTETLQKGLKKFYQQYQFKRANWGQLLDVISFVSGKNLKNFKEIWIDSKGHLQHSFIKVQTEGNPKSVVLIPNAFETKKIASQPVDLKIQTASGVNITSTVQVSSSGASVSPATIDFREAPISYVLDPDFYLFRSLSEIEKMKSFSGLFTASEIYLLVYRETWAKAIVDQFTSQVQIKQIKEQELNFSENKKIIIGLDEAWSNRQLRDALEKKKISFDGTSISLNGASADIKNIGLFVNIAIENSVITVIHLGEALPLERWLQRWKHYGQQTYIMLAEQSALAQGQWLEEDVRPVLKADK